MGRAGCNDCAEFADLRPGLFGGKVDSLKPSLLFFIARTTVAPLRQRLVDDLRLRNYSPRTIQTYVWAVTRFARHFGRSPEVLGVAEIRACQLHLLHTKKASWTQFNQTVCALRFLYRVTLGRAETVEVIPYGKVPKTLPAVLSRAEVLRVFAALRDTPLRMLVRTTYACGLRVGEVVSLRVTDIDSQRMVLHLRQGKGGKDRLLPLSPVLLEELRNYWRRYRPARCCRSTTTMSCSRCPRR